MVLGTVRRDYSQFYRQQVGTDGYKQLRERSVLNCHRLVWETRVVANVGGRQEKLQQYLNKIRESGIKKAFSLAAY